MAAILRPTGTIAFWFSDIEGSTQRWERYGETMGHALRAHDAIVRGAIETQGGYVFKTVGDAFCAAFPTAGAAVAAALAAHRALAAGDFAAVGGIRIRIAIHVGTADERDGDYFGPAVNRVARLLSTAWGGQTLLSAAAARLASEQLPPAASLRDLGAHRLKDLAEPETVAELIVPDLRSEFPPLRSLDAARHNLPAQLGPLVGREKSIAELEDALAEQRLVSLVGPGGIGKTRTALQVAANLVDRFSGGVWYVELAKIAEAELVAATIASELHLRESADRSPLEALVSWLASREAALVLDNCEHVIGEAARIAATILARCPGVRVLATSREPLQIAGEHVVHLPSLSFPPPGLVLAADEALGYEAVVLFLERAKTRDARFALTDANATIVGDICRRLDGIALAIELAASRVSVLTPAQMSGKLDARFRLLAGGDRASLPRQQTLHAALAWSYDLLEERDRFVFRRLGVFAEQFSLEAAVELCASGELDEFAVIDSVAALASKSLVAVEGSTDEKSYRLLESTRAFALLCLTEQNEASETRRRHARYALGVAERLDETWLTTPNAAWDRAALDAAPDLRAAIAWAFDEGDDVTLGLGIIASLRWFWPGLAPSEGSRQLQAARERARDAQLSPALRARLALADATISLVFGDYAHSLAAAEAALTLARSLGDEFEIAVALRACAQAMRLLGRVAESMEFLEDAAARFRRLGATRFLALTLDVLAAHHRAEGDLSLARFELEEAIAAARVTGFERGLQMFEVNLAELEFASGNVMRAIELAEAAVTRSYAVYVPRVFGIARANLAGYYAALGRWDAARQCALQAIVLGREAQRPQTVARAIEIIAAAAAEEGRPELAARLCGFADASLAALGSERDPAEAARREQLLATLERYFDGPKFAALRASGSALTEEAALELTGAVPQRASVA